MMPAGQLAQARLLDIPLVGLYPVPVEVANELLVYFGHDLGPCNRPFRQKGYALELDGRPVAVAVSAFIVNGPIRCAHGVYERGETVELARLAGERWANRVMLRVWREACGPRWPGGPGIAVSYSRNARHRGDLYRFDGWEKVREDAGSSGGGSWSRKRYATDAAYGPKTLWVWHWDGAAA